MALPPDPTTWQKSLFYRHYLLFKGSVTANLLPVQKSASFLQRVRNADF
jgi:hypothetical protein